MHTKTVTNDDQTNSISKIIEMQYEVASASMDMQNIMQFICERSQLLCDAHGAAIQMQAEDSLLYVACTGIMQPFIGNSIKMDRCLAGICYSTNRIAYTGDAPTDPKVDPTMIRDTGIFSIVVIPLIHNTDMVGVLKVVHKNRDYFTSEHINTLRLIGALLSSAISIRNAVSSKQKLLERLEYQASHDSLTSLPNRAYFFDKLKESLRLYPDKTALLFIDLNKFKEINDTLGHSIGDSLLILVSKRLINTIRGVDTLGRLGGDEFSIVLSNSSYEGATRVCNNIGNIVSPAFTIGSHSINIDCAIGISVSPNDGTTPEELMKVADIHMYDAKRKGILFAP